MDYQTFVRCISTFILFQSSANAILKKRGSNQGAFASINLGYIKIVFALLAEPVASQMQFAKIYFQKLSFKWLFI